MHRIFQKILITILLFLMTLEAIYAQETILPPKLTDVMKQNEQTERIIVRENIRKTRVFKTPILANKEILAYHTIETGKSITVSRYDSVDLWVQEIHLDGGSRIESMLTLSGYDAQSGEPLFEKKKLSEVEYSLQNHKPFSIVNGQFFDPKRSSTPLSFGIKMDGIIRTAGADNRDEPKNILIFENSKARLVPYSWENLRDAPGYFAMVNLSLERGHYSNESIGRTYMCLKNPDSNNESSDLLIFTAVSMTEKTIEDELLRWGCPRSASTKLDSSGSTRLWLNGTYIFGNSHNGNPDYRGIPHSIAIYDSSN